jgi:hypothetical protein
MLIHPQGGATRRVGTQFVLDKIPGNIEFTDSTRLIPFVFSNDEAYLVAIKENDDGYFLQVYNPEDNLWQGVFFNGGASAGWPGDSVGLGAPSANSLSDDDVVSKIQYAQSGSIMIFTHQDFPPFYLARVARNGFLAADYYRPFSFIEGTSLPLSPTDVWKRFPYTNVNTTTTTITASASSIGSGRTFTASTAIFRENMEGEYFIVSNSGTVGVAKITTYTSPTSVTGDIIQTFAGTAAYTGWRFQAWSIEYGFPRSVSFSQDQRAIFGFSKNEPEKIWFSQVGDLFELTNNSIVGGTTAPVKSDPGSLTPFSTEANAGMWLHSGSRNILAGTRGREYAIQDISGILDDTKILAQTSYGSEPVQPAAVDDIPIFVQRGHRKLREMIFDYRSEGYTAIDSTFLADNIFAESQRILGDNYVGKIRAMSYQALDNNVVWIIDSNGYLYAITRSRENQVNAFHRHELGGDYAGEFPRVLSLASIPSKDGTYDDLYLLVKRTVNGQTVRYLEKMGKQFVATQLHSDLDVREGQPFFSDSLKIYRPKASKFFAPLLTDDDADYSAGTATGTTTGTVTYTNKMASMDAASSYIDWSGTSNANFAQTGCISFEVAGGLSPFSQTTMLNISQAAGNLNNQIKLRVDYVTAGYEIRLTIRDLSGAAIINDVLLTTLGSPLFGSGPCIFEINYDLTAGATRVFFNGQQIGTTQTGTGTRNTSIGLIRLNADYNGTDSDSGLSYGNLAIFNTVQHTGNYEYFEPIPYDYVIRKLEHLEGQTVNVLANGNYIGDYTVSSGTITLPELYDTVIVGLPYTHSLEIQPIDAGTGIGSAMGSIKRIDRAVLRFNNSAACKVGPSLAIQKELVFRVASTPMGDPVELVTDDREVDFSGDYDRQARLVLSHNVPLPCSVTCLSVRGITADV